MSKPFFYFRLFIVIVMFGIGLYLLPSLPAMIPTHWNYEGVADAFGDKNTSVWLFPVIALIMTLGFPLIQKLDPKKENYDKFSSAWEAIQTCLVGFFAYAYIISLFASLPSLAGTVDVAGMMMFGVGILFIVLGNFMGKIRRNYMVGFKLPWTIENEEVWNKTHRFGGKCMFAAGIILALNSWLKFLPLGMFIFSIVLMAVIPMIYSYVIFRQIGKK